MTSQGFQRILEVLDAHRVEYVLVGGVAAVLRGAPVTTFDLDALIKIDADNAARMLEVLRVLGARFRERRDLQPTLADLSAGGHLLLITDSGPFDVLGFIAGGKRYEDVVAAAPSMQVGKLSIRVLSIDALLEDKKALGRDKDLPMVRLLEAVKRRQEQ